MIPIVGPTRAASFTFAARRWFYTTIQIDPALAGGTYYAFVLDAPGAPPDSTSLVTAYAGGTPTAAAPRVLAMLVIVHASGQAESFTISSAAPGWPNESGISLLSADVTIYLSSTAAASVTSAGAHLWVSTGGVG